MNKEQEKKSKKQLTEIEIKRLIEVAVPEPSNTDPLGSYTGRPVDSLYPIQDSDDL